MCHCHGIVCVCMHGYSLKCNRTLYKKDIIWLFISFSSLVVLSFFVVADSPGLSSAYVENLLHANDIWDPLPSRHCYRSYLVSCFVYIELESWILGDLCNVRPLTSDDNAGWARGTA